MLKLNIPGKPFADKPQDESNLKVKHYIKVESIRSGGGKNNAISLASGDLVEFEFENNLIWIAEPNDIKPLFQQKTKLRSVGEENDDEAFFIPTNIPIKDGNRNIIQNVALKFVKIFAPKATGMAVGKTAEWVEDKLLPIRNRGLNFLNGKFELIPFDKNNGQKLNNQLPVLLFIHGTLSNTFGSFEGLKQTGYWQQMVKKYGSNILAFNHETLTKSPFENALDLLKILPPDLELHLVTHSRGGLVGEVLARCSDGNPAFSKEEINNLREEGTSILKKLFTTLKEIYPAALEQVLAQTSLKEILKGDSVTDSIKNVAEIDWHNINWEDSWTIIEELKQIEWKDIDFKEFKEGIEKALLEDLLNQFQPNNRTKDADVLVALNEVAYQKNVSVKKFVRIACPAGGTTLLGDRVDYFLNILLNLAGQLTGQAANPIFLGIKYLLTTVVEQRKDPSVLPGLEAMVPGSPLLKLLNNHQIEIDGDLNIIAGNLGKGDIFRMLRYFLFRLCFGDDNDFVVDTESMFDGVLRKNDVYYKYVTGKEVHHLSYFSNSETQQAILNALEVPKGKMPKNFKKVIRGERNRNVNLPKLHYGSIYPDHTNKKENTIILLPGLMGTNLSDGKDEIWINYPRMALGGLLKLDIYSEGIEAKSILKTAYGKLVNYLSKEYDVFIFPYDWRRSLEDSAEILEKEIEQLLYKGKSIQIIAHSMGGMVVRNLMMRNLTKEDSNIWERLCENKNFRAILLGTPWKGSYLIPEVLTGQGSTINQLAALAILESKQELLEVFSKYPGLYDLLPIDASKISDNETAIDFGNLAFWKKLKRLTTNNNWVLPTENSLNKFKDNREKVNEFLVNKFLKSDDFTTRVYYIAGNADRTTDNLLIQDQFQEEYPTIEAAEQVLEKNLTQIKEFQEKEKDLQGKSKFPPPLKKFDLVYTSTSQGDGSVTWDRGIPVTLNETVYFANDTIHGELANDERIFAAIKGILQTGSTLRLSQTRPSNRSTLQYPKNPKTVIVNNDPEVLMRGVIGLKAFKSFTPSNPFTTPSLLKISVKNGHLKYADNPILIGHFKNDIITSAENVLDKLLNDELSQRAELGVYPGEIGSNLVILPDEENDMGAIIVGLGEPEELTPNLLKQTIELGCLNYLLALDHTTKKNEEDGVGISSLLVGSNYVSNISIYDTVNAIIKGVIDANQKIKFINTAQDNKKSNKQFLTITHLEFIELYEHKSILAFHHLNEIEGGKTFANIDVYGKRRIAEGRRTYYSIEESNTWWRRLTAIVRKNPKSGAESLYFNASSKKASVEEVNIYHNRKIITALLKENSKTSLWNKKLMKSVFNLIIPNDFKMIFRNQQNILLILDKDTAEFPWELLHYDEFAEAPICVSSGMIRQLSTTDRRKIIKPVNANTAFIVGNPILDVDSAIPSLPAAEEEAHLVRDKLIAAGFDTVSEIKTDLTSIFSNLYDNYKVIHFASHGVVDFKANPNDPTEEPQTGLLLSDNVVLTPSEINQMDTTPELVFINSCFAGQMDGKKEAYSRERFKLAANIGTQFIENGAKAVVVAGWAIDDNAAHRFAEIFYDQMLSGSIFAKAVQDAREVCYREYGHTNTWGAYQCYGDQYYRLVTKKNGGFADTPYLDRKQILADLENFVNSAKSSRKRGSALEKKLRNTSKKIDTSGLRDAQVLELEALAYTEIELNQEALEKYEALKSIPKANYSVRSKEISLNLKARHLAELKINGELLAEDEDAAVVKAMKEEQDKEKKKEIKRELKVPGYKQLKAVIDELIALNDEGVTVERYNLIASAYRRQFILLKDLSEKKKDLKKEREATIDAVKLMTENYQKAYQLNKLLAGSEEIHPLTNWLIGVRILLQEEGLNVKRTVEFDKLPLLVQNELKEDVIDFLNKKLKAIKKGNRGDFWDIITNVNIYQCQLLYCDEKDIEKYTEKIKKEYQRAWSKDGSFKQKSSEILQMIFIYQALSLYPKRNEKLQAACKKLKLFFENLE